MELLLLLCVLGLTAALLAWPVWFKLETRAKRRKNPGYNPPNVMGILDELYQPSAHQASQIQEVQRVLPAPAPLPGDKDLERGRVTIDLAPSQNSGSAGR